MGYRKHTGLLTTDLRSAWGRWLVSARDLADTHHASLATRIYVPCLAVIPQAALTNRELLFQRRIQICQGICLARLRDDDAPRRKIKREREKEISVISRYNFNSKKGIECIIDVSVIVKKFQNRACDKFSEEGLHTFEIWTRACQSKRQPRTTFPWVVGARACPSRTFSPSAEYNLCPAYNRYRWGRRRLPRSIAKKNVHAAVHVSLRGGRGVGNIKRGGLIGILLLICTR